MSYPEIEAVLRGESRWCVVQGDCLDVMRTLPDNCVDAVVTDPPYPNGEGYFLDGIAAARQFLSAPPAPVVLWCWSEVETPACPYPLVAVHIWHRTNVNGKIYEPFYHFAADGKKRRSEVMRGPAIFDGAGPGCREYAGHPNQKPRHVMAQLLRIAGPKGAIILDPFCGSGSTGVAAVDSGYRFIGIELQPEYAALSRRRIADAAAQGSLF